MNPVLMWNFLSLSLYHCLLVYWTSVAITFLSMPIIFIGLYILVIASWIFWQRFRSGCYLYYVNLLVCGNGKSMFGAAKLFPSYGYQKLKWIRCVRSGNMTPFKTSSDILTLSLSYSELYYLRFVWVNHLQLVFFSRLIRTPHPTTHPYSQ